MRQAFQITIGIALILLFWAQASTAGDFNWAAEFNAKAESDSEFRTRISNRFQLQDAQIRALLTEIPTPSETYIVLRMQEISRKPLDQVVAEYKFSRNQGWSVVARRLGISRNSAEFQTLRRKQDLYR